MQRPTLLAVTIASVSFASFVGGLHARSVWFTDVPSDHWATRAIEYVSQEGLMTGLDSNTFAPDEPVTRAQLAMVLYRQNREYPAPSVPEPYVPPAPTENPPTIENDAVRGDTKATVTLIEFGDYQCPFCKRHFDQTQPLIKKNYIDTGKVKFVFRDFPLSFHPHAQLAAEASECAHAQGKFWEMHDKLYSEQESWLDAENVEATFKQYARDIKVNGLTFDACLDNHQKASEIEDDMSDGSASGISGTPGFWILGPNGQSKQISGAYAYETFKAAFDEMLN